MTADQIIDTLVEARLREGLTQAQVAQALGVSRVAMTSRELGYNTCPPAQLIKWAETLGYELVLKPRRGRP